LPSALIKFPKFPLLYMQNVARLDIVFILLFL
jgi:hypothetical protein